MSPTIFLVLFVIALAIIIDNFLMRWWAKRNRDKTATSESVRVLGTHSPFLTWLKTAPARWRQEGIHLPRLRVNWSQIPGRLKAGLSKPQGRWIVVEILIIVTWSAVITRPYLNLETDVIPTGLEFPLHIQTHHLWRWLVECGPCAMWNSAIRGGAPAFADLHGSMLHPLVAVNVLAFGVVNGSKLALAAAFLMAGLAQLWLGYVLGVGRTARLWSALMAVAGGHLAARMEVGMFGGVLSTAACTLVLPPLILLAQTGRRRAAVLVGITLAMAIVAGQGYLQLGLFCIMPAIYLLIPHTPDLPVKSLARRFALAALIAFLLAAPFLAPVLHFLPQFSKESMPEFEMSQPLEYIPLNLVIRDGDFYRTETLSKPPYPWNYANYIGWVAVLLAVFSLLGSRTPQERRARNFFLAAILLLFWIASAQPLRWLVQNISNVDIKYSIASIRFVQLVAGLAVPLILGMAAMGLDQLLSKSWPKLQVQLLTAGPDPLPLAFRLEWLIAIPLFFALGDAQEFGENYIRTNRLDSSVYEIIQALQTPDLQWTNPLFGDHAFTEAAAAAGLKISIGTRCWMWKNRPLPEPVLEAVREDAPTESVEDWKVAGITVFRWPAGREYARVVYNDDESPPTVCNAYGKGGNIDVTCQTTAQGILTVKEYSWSGWHARIDGKRTSLISDNWLSVHLPAGEHTITFRYRPWDVPLGVILCLAGLVLAFYAWFSLETKDEIKTI